MNGSFQQQQDQYKMTKLLIRTCRYYVHSEQSSLSALFTKSPKQVTVQQSSNWLTRLLEHSKRSPSYLLLTELFHFLTTSPTIARQFPLLGSQLEFLENNMVMHVILLLDRFIQQKDTHESISIIEVKKVTINAQVYFFPAFVQHLHPQLPVSDFQRHFAETLHNRLVSYHEEMKSQESTNQQKSGINYAFIIRRLVYRNRLSLNDLELLKYCKYYAAHKKYLTMLSWQDIMSYKVKWGFDGDTRLIDQL